jgi:NAD(P)H-dependent FMN reductase
MYQKYKGRLNVMKLLVVIGSVRNGRAGPAVAKMVTNQLDSINSDYEVADLKELDLPFVNQELIPSASNKKYDDERVQKWSKMVDEADAYIFVTPEYNHGPPASLKNALDWLYSEWHNKPIALVGYGGMGATRAMHQLRANMLRVKLFPLAEIPIPGFKDYIKEGVLINERAEKGVVRAVETLNSFNLS